MRNLLEGVQLDSYQCFLPRGCPRPRVEALLRALLPMEKYKREQLSQVLRQFRASVCAAMEQRSGLDTAMQSAAQMVASRSGAELLQTACDLQTAIDSLDANVSAGAVIGWLAMKLR